MGRTVNPVRPIFLGGIQGRFPSWIPMESGALPLQKQKNNAVRG